MVRISSQTCLDVSKWSRRSPAMCTSLTRPQPCNSRMLLLTLERATLQGLGDFLGVHRSPRDVEQRVDLRHRAVDAPTRTHLAPVKNEAGQGRREVYDGILFSFVISDNTEFLSRSEWAEALLSGLRRVRFQQMDHRQQQLVDGRRPPVRSPPPHHEAVEV